MESIDDVISSRSDDESDTSSASPRNGDVTQATTERKEQNATPPSIGRSCVKGAEPQTDANQLKEDNDRLRRKVKYMENLGILVTGYKQENQNLIQENLLLRKRMEELKMNGGEGGPSSEQQTSRCHSNGTDVTDQSTPSTSSQSSINYDITPSSSTSLSRDNVKEEEKTEGVDDAVDRVASLFLSHAVDAPSNVSSDHDDVTDKGDPTSDVLPGEEHAAFNSQIAQLEEMVGLRQPSNDSEASIAEPSVTSQFTKLAAVFASLAQRVVRSQKKASKSQAFCDALMADNEKMKNLLKQINSQLDAVKRENEELKERQKAPTRDRTSPVSTTTCVKLTTAESNTKKEPESVVILKLQARVKKLEKQRTEILRVNKSWDVQYKKLKHELDRRTREWEERAPNPDAPSCSRTQTYSEEGHRDPAAYVAELKKEIRLHVEERADLARNFSAAHARCQELKSEIGRLKEAERKLKGDKTCLEAENTRLNQALEAAYSIHERKSISIPEERYESNRPPARDGGSSQDELQTRVEVLQEQVKIYREDFETERRDREKNQTEKQRLDEALTVARHEVQALSQQVRTLQQDFRQERVDKERIQRQVQKYQGSHRDGGSARSRNRFHGDMNDPPAYYRFPDEDDLGLFNQSQTRRRSRRSPPHYEFGMNPPNWGRSGAVDNDAILSYPPEGTAEPPY